LSKKSVSNQENVNNNGKERKFYFKCSPTAKTEEQKEVLKSFNQNDITFVEGCAGTGKSYLATMWALHEFGKGNYDKIIFTRPAVEAYGEKLGFLPGDADEKLAPYMFPLVSFMLDVMTDATLNALIKEKKILTIPLAFQRGINFHKAIVVGDEFQNTIPKQMRMFLTRLEMGSKIIVTGDLKQSDIPEGNGLSDALERFKDIEGIGVCRLTEESIVRHPIIKTIEKKYNEK